MFTGRRSAGTIALVATIVLGVAATYLSVRAAYDASNDRERQSAALAAARLSGALEQAVGSLRGADALAADGVVEADEFRMFARGVVSGSLYVALAYAEVVERDEREAFLERTGVTVTDTDGAGGFVAAEPRDRSVIVVEVFPQTDAAMNIVGFDIAGEDVRRRAIERADVSPTPVLSDRSRTATSGLVGVSVVHAVRTPDDRVVGYVTSGLSVQDSLSRARVPASPDDRVGLWMDGEQLSANTPSRGADREFVVAERTFTIRIDTPRDLELLLPVLIGLGTLALAAVVTLAALRDRRQRDELGRLARRNLQIAEFGRLLAATPNATSVVEVVTSSVGPVLDGARCLVVRRAADHPDDLSPEPSDVAPTIAEWLVEGPVVRCVSQGEVIDGQAVDDASPPPGVGAFLCVPLSFSGGFTAGALALVWPEPAPTAIREERRVAATTIAELAARALERALVTEFVRVGAERLSTFARVLAAAPTTEDIRTAVTEHVPTILGAQSASLALTTRRPSPDDGTGGTLTRTIVGPDGDDAAVLTVRWRRQAMIGSTQQAVLVTLADLIEQTLGRTMRSQQQLDVIAQLQRELLAEPKHIEGLDVAVGYQPALTGVGLGGDFYDLVVSDGGRVFAVIGDITGHGPRAVAVMSELKSVMHHLLRSDTPLADVIDQADRLLVRRDVLATVQIFEFDLVGRAVRFVNAGHPYPVLRRADGSIELLRDGHRALLGLSGHDEIATVVASAAFDQGDALVLYTDGLIERRHGHLDDAIGRLAERVGAADDASMADLVTRLLDELGRPEQRRDDDIALLAVRSVSH
ncbi:MAG TPA: SpoIIE family protein phosphatase [Ilumatobacteraceae bacterium]|nr:SpoIIE family protein phosphatase [Ilumatobacteraceae bacterium]